MTVKNKLVGYRKKQLKKRDKASSIILEDKVDDYLNWYKENVMKEQSKQVYIDIMRNFIEKMAVWYELRYPEYEINRLMPDSSQERIFVSEEMFKNNSYIQDLVGEGTDIEALDWCDFYNFDAFFNSLPGNEQKLLYDPKYPKILCYGGCSHIHLDNEGYIVEAEGIPFLKNIEYCVEIPHIKNVVEYIKSYNIPVPITCEFERAVTNYENQLKQKEGMLDCVMYRIIERGGNRIGPRRALLFAKEFQRDVSIPMIYGVDTFDPGLRNFMNEYFKAGGSKDIMSIRNYFYRASKYENLEKVSMEYLIKIIPDNPHHKYTEEETETHERLVNILAYQAKVKKYEIK